MLGERLCEKLKENKISQKELAAKVGVSQWSVSMWCNNKLVPKDEMIATIAKALNCSVEYLKGNEAEVPDRELKKNASGYNDPTAFKAMKALDGGTGNRMEYLRGDIFFVEKIGGTMDSEPNGERPAIIVSNDIGNKYSPNVEVVYLTSQKKNPMPTHVGIVCRTFSTAMCENIDTVSKNRLGNYIRSLKENEMKAIDAAISVSLGLKTNEQPTNIGSEMIEAMQKKVKTYEGTCLGLQNDLNKSEEEKRNLCKKLDALEAELTSVKKVMNDLNCENDVLDKSNRELREANNKLKETHSASDSQEVVALRAQLEIYKEQNTMLFERLIGA